MQVRVGFVQAASWPLLYSGVGRVWLESDRPGAAGYQPGGAVIPERRPWRSGGARGVMRTVNRVAGGRYPLIGLSPGDYSTQASAPSQVAELLKISLRPGKQTANL